MSTTLLREELVEYSVLRFIREGLAGYGFTPGSEAGEGVNVIVREAFPTPDERAEELEITTLAFGFNVDDGGRPVELGSNLTEYKHTLVVWVFATEPRFGRRLAHSIKHIVRNETDNIPLLDFNEEGDPEIDILRVDKAQVKHEVNNSPRPWDQYVWTCSITVQDISFPV